MNVLPAINTVPVRLSSLSLPFGKGSTLIVTLPFPVPLAPFVIVIQENDVVAVQGHPAPAVTSTVLVSPSLSKSRDVGLMEYSHPFACVTVNTFVAMVSVPVRAGPELEATLNRTVPLPLPLAPCVTVIHCEALTAVHAHPVAAVTET